MSSVTKIYRKPSGGCAKDCRQGRDCPRREVIEPGFMEPNVCIALIVVAVSFALPLAIYFFPS
jgi:hypothetical protein